MNYIEIALLVLNLIILIALILRSKRDDDKRIIEEIQRLDARIQLENQSNRKEMSELFSLLRREIKEELYSFLKESKAQTSDNATSFEKLIKEKLEVVEERQKELIRSTESKLDIMRETVDEKLSKTLNERLTKSFETVDKQLESVREGLGEMKALAQDVGGLKKVLSNVKMRGGVGEVQLQMLLEQMLAPSQYEANVKTKRGSSDLVEFAIKLPGKDDGTDFVYLPIDAKFPKDAYEQLVDAYESGDQAVIESCNKNMENTIRKMAKDISDKYIDPPATTDFAVLFLPFESIYAEVIRRSHLIEQLQRDYKVIVTGPTTLAAILNSLQMGFRTLAIQKRSGEVWTILGQVKSEFEKFGGLLEKAKKNIDHAGNTIDELIGRRSNAIERKLKNIEVLPSSENANPLELGDE